MNNNFLNSVVIVTILIILTIVFTLNNNAQTPIQIVDGCKFDKLPYFYDVYAVSSYEGFTKINTIIDASGRTNGLNDVIVNIKKKPIILVLTAVEPVVWRIQSTAETNIAGVVLGGYYNQAILGISKNIPVLNYTYSQKNCGYFYLGNALENIETKNIQKIQEITGKRPVSIKYKYYGDTFYVGQPLKSTDKIIYSNDYNIDDYQIKSNIIKKNTPKETNNWQGNMTSWNIPQKTKETNYIQENNVSRTLPQKPREINYWQRNTTAANIPQDIRATANWKENATVYFVNNNYLRKANIADIKNWEYKAREPYQQTMGSYNANNIKIEHDMSTDHTYVVQKSFKIPDDFCYGHFINFIIPPWVSAPENKQNCGFYFLKDGSKM